MTIAHDNYKREYSPDFVSHWDQLIGWEGRERGEGGFFRRILAAHDKQSVLDCACGTGFHSVVLANEGFEVTATDGSQNMIRQTIDNAETYDAELKETRVADWLNLAKEFPANHFDSVVCLGNAFTHLFDHETRRDALANMYAVLKPGGVLIIDHRNYDRMLNEGFSTKHQYYYTGKGVDARPVVVNKTLTHFEYTFPDGEVFHLKMYPLKQGYMRFLLEDAGFVDILSYGDFERPFDESATDFIQQVATKPLDDPAGIGRNVVDVRRPAGNGHGGNGRPN